MDRTAQSFDVQIQQTDRKIKELKDQEPAILQSLLEHQQERDTARKQRDRAVAGRDQAQAGARRKQLQLEEAKDRNARLKAAISEAQHRCDDTRRQRHEELRAFVAACEQALAEPHPPSPHLAAPPEPLHKTGSGPAAERGGGAGEECGGRETPDASEGAQPPGDDKGAGAGACAKGLAPGLDPAGTLVLPSLSGAANEDEPEGRGGSSGDDVDDAEMGSADNGGGSAPLGGGVGRGGDAGMTTHQGTGSGVAGAGRMVDGVRGAHGGGCCSEMTSEGPGGEGTEAGDEGIGESGGGQQGPSSVDCDGDVIAVEAAE